MKEFKVNKYITLKLENGKTNIYVNDKLFNQCKFLLLNIPVERIESFDEIKSVDEAAEKLDQSLERIKPDKIQIPHEVEFWGHCSNIQVWMENDYNTRLLHSNLAFPLLRKLVSIGDPKAIKVFKEELTRRIESGYLPTINFILENNYINYFSEDELYSMLSNLDINIKCYLMQFFEEKHSKYKKILKKYYDEIYEEYKCFRGAYIPLKEVNALKSIEKIIKVPKCNHHKFKLIDNFEYDPRRLENPDFSHASWAEKWFEKGKALFKIKNNHVEGIYILDPGSCDSCFDKDNPCPPSVEDCKECGLKIPHSIDSFTSLKELFISTNYMISQHSIANSFFRLRTLEALFLQGCFSSTVGGQIPKDIGMLSSLKALYLGCNGLKWLPDSFKKLKNLEYLSLQNNLFEEIPEVIYSLKSLKLLNLEDNYIKYLSESIRNLKSLEELILSNNELTTLPESILKCKNLKTIIIEENPITKLPNKLSNNIYR